MHIGFQLPEMFCAVQTITSRRKYCTKRSINLENMSVNVNNDDETSFENTSISRKTLIRQPARQTQHFYTTLAVILLHILKN